jgi:uncharacterized Zn-finger protein
MTKKSKRTEKSSSEVICPHCGQRLTRKDSNGKEYSIVCPYCFEKGTINTHNIENEENKN